MGSVGFIYMYYACLYYHLLIIITNQIKEELMVLTGSGGNTEGVGWRKVGEK